MIKGPSHGGGGINVGNYEVEGGEYFVNRLSASRNRAQLDDINFNQGKQILAFQKGIMLQQNMLATQQKNVNMFAEITKDFNDLLKDRVKKQEDYERSLGREGEFGVRDPGYSGGSSVGQESRRIGDFKGGPTRLPVQQFRPLSPRQRSLELARPNGGSAVVALPPQVQPKPAPQVLQQSTGANDPSAIDIDSFDENNDYIIQAYERYGIFLN